MTRRRLNSVPPKRVGKAPVDDKTHAIEKLFGKGEAMRKALGDEGARTGEEKLMVYEVRLAKVGGAPGAPTGLLVRAGSAQEAREYAGRYYFENGWNLHAGAAMALWGNAQATVIEDPEPKKLEAGVFRRLD
jgi:hypothetical protein